MMCAVTKISWCPYIMCPAREMTSIARRVLRARDLRSELATGVWQLKKNVRLVAAAAD